MTAAQIRFTGNLTEDPELRFTPSGAAVANLRVAVNSRRLDKSTNQWIDEPATFYSVSAWNRLAENVAGSLKKGMQVTVDGSFKTREYTAKDGAPRLSLDVMASDVAVSLQYATVQVTRNPREDGQGAGMPRVNRNGGYGAAAPQQQAADPWSSQPAMGAAQGDSEPPF